MTGLLLLNLGTPDSPNTPDVRRYLREFLMDPRVLDINGLSRWLLVNGVIAPFRSPKSAAAYKTVWLPEGSPLLVYGVALREAMQQALGQGYKVALGMRYGRPGAQGALAELAGCERIIVLPLYPQFASASTASSLAQINELAAQMAVPPPLHIIQDFYDHPAFIHAQAELAREAVAQADHVLFSYHGVPERQLKTTEHAEHCLAKDYACCAKIVPANRHCYRAQCQATTSALIKALNLDPEHTTQSFQSRLGKTPWIQPFTDEVLPELAKTVKTLAVLTPSFTADCLETIEEIGDRASEQFIQAGGESLLRVPCVNATQPWVDGLAEWVRGL